MAIPLVTVECKLFIVMSYLMALIQVSVWKRGSGGRR